MRRPIVFFSFSLLALPLIAGPLQARDSLGIFGQWGAFRDAEVPRCYAIAADEDGDGAYVSVGTWPEQEVRSQLHFRLSRSMRGGADINLLVGSERFELTGDDDNAWASSPAMDEQIVTAMRSASDLRISASDTQGRRFTDSFSLDGAATAVDAARIGCSGGG